MPDELPRPTPADLEAIGRACFGPLWQRPLAASLPVNYRTLQRWIAGTNAIAPWAARALRDLAAAEIAAAAARREVRAAQASIAGDPTLAGLARDADAQRTAIGRAAAAFLAGGD